ncbi:hypothetical protein XFF6166_580003 [Xanthomonas citri pv. fuscans]|nr:hypothetical protein XFF6166_580003 [Xanthomonas citri pv. fuscans]SOO03232.1 hypothetical protein XFF6960_810004 [Xanthomonas citri pv. fuscans]SOO05890.1 hypothetical protein XFF7767_500004 [Xanthomonas citri pv. fuscans]SOO10319.1 hypothetical protein XFF6970_530003 [Xanthomonas citri pv. fuscans]SOO16541.1 hypothetical protein XFF7766_800003 [Xanthomonas citri pv. fuscans]
MLRNSWEHFPNKIFNYVALIYAWPTHQVR